MEKIQDAHLEQNVHIQMKKKSVEKIMNLMKRITKPLRNRLKNMMENMNKCHFSVNCATKSTPNLAI